nr:class I SAM-dependent methyltransferase [uncultured Rhodopila sp.]
MSRKAALDMSTASLASAWRLLQLLRGGKTTGYRERYWIACALSWLPLRLDWILHVFGTDKQAVGDHQYGATYHRELVQFRYKPVTLLEIGVLNGASLLSWRAFFPRGRFIGSDIEPKTRFERGRISTFLADQSRTTDLQLLCQKMGPFDIIIDDGSHLSAHQILTFYEMFPVLRNGGLYIIEDVQTSFWPGFFGGTTIFDPAFRQSCVGEFLELAKYLNHNEFFSKEGLDARRLAFAKTIKSIAFEHNLIIIRKGPNDDPSNFERQAKMNNNWGWPS